MKKIFKILVFVFAVFFISNNVFASSETLTEASGNSIAQTFQLNSTTTINSITMPIAGSLPTGKTPAYAQFVFYSLATIDSTTYTGLAGNVSTYFDGSCISSPSQRLTFSALPTTLTNKTFDLAVPVTLSAGYYRLVIFMWYNNNSDQSLACGNDGRMNVTYSYLTDYMIGNRQYYTNSGVINKDSDVEIALNATLTPTITNSTPAQSSTVSSNFTITGVYTNDSTYDSVMYELFDDTNAGVDALVIKCADAKVGFGISYSCNYQGRINTSYRLTPYLYNSNYPYPFGSLLATNGSISFNTNAELNIPPIGGQTCSTFDVGCYVVNGIKYLLYPSDLTLSNFTSLMDIIKNKPPIGYVSGVITGLGAININATPTLSFASFTPITIYIFTPIRTGLIVVLWFGFMFVLFKRFQQLDI